MLNSFILLVFAVLALAYASVQLARMIKVAAKPVMVLALIFAMTVGFLSGGIIGHYDGQLMLLKDKKSLWSPEIRITKHPRFPSVLSLAKIDTVYESHWSYRVFAIPTASPKFFTNKQDTLWHTAIFSYTKH